MWSIGPINAGPGAPAKEHLTGVYETEKSRPRGLSELIKKPRKRTDLMIMNGQGGRVFSV